MRKSLFWQLQNNQITFLNPYFPHIQETKRLHDPDISTQHNVGTYTRIIHTPCITQIRVRTTVVEQEYGESCRRTGSSRNFISAYLAMQVGIVETWLTKVTTEYNNMISSMAFAHFWQILHWIHHSVGGSLYSYLRNMRNVTFYCFDLIAPCNILILQVK